MAETTKLTDHQEIRDWAAARAGKPMMHYISNGAGDETPVLSLTFGQGETHHGSLESSSIEGRQLVEWNDWFAAFDKEGLALSVPPQKVGSVDDGHQIVKR